MEKKLGISYYNKAEEYRNTVNLLVSSDIYNSSVTVLNELAMECYMSSVIELAKNKSMEQIYGRGLIPHDLFGLYNDMYNADKDMRYLGDFDRTIRQELKSAFKDYNASRFPKDQSYVVINEETIKFNVSLMEDIRELAEEYINSYNRNLKTPQKN